MRYLPLVLILGLWPSGAGAIDIAQFTAMTPLLEPTPGARRCLQRRYDDDHLRAHPQQKVKALTLLLIVQGFDANGDAATKNAERILYRFALSARRRGDAKPLTASGDCQGTSEARCGVECDGGGFGLDPNAGGVTLKLSGEGVAFGNDCDANRGEFIAPGADDKVFRLDPAPDAACAGLGKALPGP